MTPALNGSTSISNGHANGANGVHPAKKGSLDGFGTRAIHAGSEANEETGAVIPPISLSTTYKQNGVGIHKVRPQNGGIKYSRG